MSCPYRNLCNQIFSIWPTWHRPSVSACLSASLCVLLHILEADHTTGQYMDIGNSCIAHTHTHTHTHTDRHTHVWGARTWVPRAGRRGELLLKHMRLLDLCVVRLERWQDWFLSSCTCVHIVSAVELWNKVSRSRPAVSYILYGACRQLRILKRKTLPTWGWQCSRIGILKGNLTTCWIGFNHVRAE